MSTEKIDSLYTICINRTLQKYNRFVARVTKIQLVINLRHNYEVMLPN